MKARTTVLLIGMFAMLAMLGVVVAEPASVDIADDPIINPLDGSTVTTTTVTITNISWSLGDPQTRTICVITSDPNLYARVTGNDANGNPVDTGFTNDNRVCAQWVADSSVATTYTFTLEVKGTSPGLITVSDNYGTTYSDNPAQDTASATRPVEIPEFVTMAIPAALALLAGLFVLRRR